MNPSATRDDQRIHVLAAPPAICPGCVAEVGAIFPPGATARHCPRHLAAVQATAPITAVSGMTLTFLGNARFSLGERAKAQRLTQLGQEGYIQYLTRCLQGDRVQILAEACRQVATLTTRSGDWLTALCILYELNALPDPLVVTLAPGVVALPLVEVPGQEVRFVRR